MLACGLDADYKSCDLLQDWLHLWKAACGGRLPSLVSFILTLFQIQSFSSKIKEMSKQWLSARGGDHLVGVSWHGAQWIFLFKMDTVSPESDVLYRNALAEINFCFQGLWEQLFHTPQGCMWSILRWTLMFSPLWEPLLMITFLLLQSWPSVSSVCLGKGAVPC